MGRRLAFDLESNDLLEPMIDHTSLPYKLKSTAKLWVLAFRDMDTGELFRKCQEEITKEWIQEVLIDCDVLSGHNIIKFDLPVLHLFGLIDYDIRKSTIDGKKIEIVDTLIRSRLYNPARKGHSLKYWGEILGEYKDDYRKACIEAGYIAADAPKGEEFRSFNPIMPTYCDQDTLVSQKVFLRLEEERLEYPSWEEAERMEHILAHLSICRETYGFYFDRDLALEYLDTLGGKMQELADKVNPLLPPKPLNKTERAKYTPPQSQIKKDGEPSKHMLNFAARHNAELFFEDDKYYFIYKGDKKPLPLTEALETHISPDISHTDHVKSYLLEIGWDPIEWRERDLTKDQKKNTLPINKRLEALSRYLKQTIEGRYTKERLEMLEISESDIKYDPVNDLYRVDSLVEKLKDKWPVKVPTSPMVKVGADKHICPNLEKLGEKVAFAKDFSLYMTYRHRRNSIAGGEDIDEIDWENDEDYTPNTGFLAHYREEDGRIPTPANELFTPTARYSHKIVCNIPRVGSTWGYEQRNLFGANGDYVQFSYDFSSLEAVIESHYIYKYTNGIDLGKMLIAEKPNDLHTQSSIKYGVPRSDAKSINYAILYSASPKKLAKMIGCSLEKAQEIYDGFWEMNVALKELMEKVVAYWESTGKKYILGLDGRKIFIRSKHSICNSLLQSGGSIAAKHTLVKLSEILEQKGIKMDVFRHVPDAALMIEQHDEANMSVNKKYFKFKSFKTEEEAQKFVDGWQGRKLSGICHGKNDTYYVALPNVISESVEEAIDYVNKRFKLNVDLKFEYKISQRWGDCH